MKTKEERIQDLKNFVKVNNRLPSRHSKNPFEKSLADWIHDNKKKYPEVKEIFDKYRYRKKSKERLRELNVFVKINNKLPSQKSKNPIEKSLGRWVQMCKKKYPGIQEIWNKFKHPKTPEERLQELKGFIEVNNKLPSAYSKDPTERSLGNWTHLCKKKYPEVQEIYDKFKHRKTPEERLQELKEFIEVNNRLPSKESKNPIEKSLAVWVSLYGKKKYPEVQEIWDSFEHPKTPEERFLELREWVIKNNKLPSKYSKDYIEKSLGYWKNMHRDWDILKQFIAIFKFKDEHPELWELEISEA